jgi:hypothetical protein
MRFSDETVVECWQGALTDAPAPEAKPRFQLSPRSPT